MDCEKNAPGHGNNLVNGINVTKKLCLKGKMELVGHLKTNDKLNIGIITFASKSGSINFSEQCLHIFTHKYQLN